MNIDRRTGLDSRLWAQRFYAVKARLQEPIWWYPFPLMISFGLVLLLTSHVLFGTNSRVGNPADIITFPSETHKDSALWMTMTPIGDEIVVTTGDRHVFRWKQEVRSLAELQPFIAYLKARVANEIESAALLKRAYTTQTQAVIAADQRLKFLHVRPVLHALAEAGISQYAFETQNPVVAGPAEEAHGEVQE